MRFAMILPDRAVDTLRRRFRADLDLFNIGLVGLQPLSFSSDGATLDGAEAVLTVLAFGAPWDGVFLSCADADRVDDAAAQLKQVAGRVRRVLGSNVPVAAVDRVGSNASQQLFDGVMRLWLLRTVALDCADRAAEL